MSSSPDMFVGLCSVVLTGVCLTAWSAPGGGTGIRKQSLPRDSMESVRLPVEFYPDGALKAEIRAAGASMPDRKGDVRGGNVMVMFFKPDGKTVEGRIWAETCRFNHGRGTADSEGPVRFEREGVSITGRGFDWSAKEEIVRIHHDVRVEIDRGKVRKEWKNAPAFGR